MPWRFSGSLWRSSARVVLGVDLGTDFCACVVLTGAAQQPQAVSAVHRWPLPAHWQGLAARQQVRLLGPWLRSQLQAMRRRPQVLCLALDDGLLTHHSLTLPKGLSHEDVAFQVRAELQTVLPEVGSEAGPATRHDELCVDYQVAPADANEGAGEGAGVWAYHVQAVPRAWVDDLQQFARAAQLDLQVVTHGGQAQRLGLKASRSWPLAEHEPLALGLALSAWATEVVNFLPHRERAQTRLRRGWLQRITLSLLSGLALAGGLTQGLSWAAQEERLAIQRRYSGDETAMAQRLDAARKAYAQAQQRQRAMHDVTRWVQARARTHADTLQWVSVLGQASAGVWLAQVTQDGAQWQAQGEAMSAAHAQALAAQLKALTIWARAPELTLQQQPSTQTSHDLPAGLPVWQFRLVAQLKEVAE